MFNSSIYDDAPFPWMGKKEEIAFSTPGQPTMQIYILSPSRVLGITLTRPGRTFVGDGTSGLALRGRAGEVCTYN